MKLREYTKEDYKRICEIHDLARMNELKASNLEKAFVPLEIAAEQEGLFEYTLKVAIIDSDIVGFVGYKPEELGWLYVDPNHAKKGIGRALVEHVIKQETGSMISLEVISDNTPAVKFYEKMGFVYHDQASGNMPGNEEFYITVNEMRYLKD